MDKRCMTKKLLQMVIGTLILSFGIYNFYYQNGITEGGVLGLLLIFKNVFNVDVSLSNVFIDGLLILLGFRFFGKKFFGYTIFSTVVFSIVYGIFEKFGFLVTVDNNIIAAILGGVCVGVGCGIIINAGGAAGGDDIVALIFSKMANVSIGKVYLITDVTVLILSLSYLPASKIIYSIIAVVVSGQVINIMYKFNDSIELVPDLTPVADGKLAA
ncbi:YitT family protein [Peptostreptococcus porci]|uniref:YitT family protein n=2 Tax=Peptostreptococcus porci TaxID=2652282 RepID=UPI0023F41761|nr:YitT family protein [Peptostreptococcus porci]MDD7183831.1 YitT family protein [Peptostreptococcus porci]